MRRILEHIVLLGLLALDNLVDLFSDRDERVDESVELFLVLRLGRLDQPAPSLSVWDSDGSHSFDSRRDRPLGSRRVERVILQSLRKVDDLQTGTLFKLGQID
jgi:hypothetical protein